MLRALRWLVIVLLVLVVAVLALVRFAPAVFAPVIESAAQSAGYGISYDDIGVAFFPLELTLAGLQVSGRDSTEPFAAVADATVSLHPLDFLSDEAWLGGDLSGVQVYLDRLPATDPAPAKANAHSAEESTELDLSPLGQLKRLAFADISVFQRADEPPILALGGSLNPYASDASTSGLGFLIAGDVMDLAVDLSGRVEQGAVPRLVISAQRLDLSPLLSGEAGEALNTGEAGTSEQAPRQALDLRPLAGASLNLNFADAGNQALAVEGLLSLPTLIIEIKIDELLGVREEIPLSNDDLLPLELAVEIDGDLDRLSYELASFNWGPNALAGTGSVDFEPLRIVSTLQAEALHLPRSEPALDEGDSVEDKAESGPVFSDAPIDWTWLAGTLVDVRLTVSELHVLDAVFSQVALRVAGENGELSLTPLTGTFGNGGFDGSLALTQQTEGVALASAFDLEGVDLQAFGFVPEEELTGGALIARIALTGAGVSLADLAASLDGSILVTVQDAIVQNDTFELIGSDLLMETLNKLNPFAKSDPTTRLDCALIQFEVAQGVLTASNSLVVETEKMEIIGDGTIDLNDETLSIGFSPSSRAGVGVNVGSLVKFLKLGGTLSAPRPTADAAGLLKSGAAVGAAMSTGGVSILAEGMFKRLANAGSACERALAGEPILAPVAPSEAPSDLVDQSSSG